MSNIKCDNCGKLIEIKSETIIFCPFCDKKLNNSFSEWKKSHEGKSLNDYLIENRSNFSENSNIENKEIYLTENTNFDNKKKQKINRPLILSILCWYVFVIGLLFGITIIFTYQELSNVFGSWYPPTVGFLMIGGIIGCLGIYRMKKWGAYIYIGTQVIGDFVGNEEHMINNYGYISIAVSVLCIGIVLYHIQKMTD